MLDILHPTLNNFIQLLNQVESLVLVRDGFDSEENFGIDLRC